MQDQGRPSLTNGLGMAGLAALLAALLVTAAPQPLAAQETGQAARSVVDAAKRTNPRLKVRIDPITGLPTSIRGLSPNAALGASRSVAPEAPADDAARDAAARQAAESFFSGGELAAAFSARNPDAKVEAVKVRPDPDFQGQRIVNVEQRVNGVPVFGSTGKVIVSPSLAVTQLSASLSTVDIKKTTPSIDKDAAITTARGYLSDLVDKRSRDRSLNRLRGNIGTAEARADTVVYDPALLRARGAKAGPARLTWMVTIEAFRMFVDAETSDVIFSYYDQPSAGLRQVYDLAAATKFPGKKLIDDATSLRPEQLPADADHAYRNTGSVDDFLGAVLGRKGIADDEAKRTPLESYVRYGDVENAYWCKDPGTFCPKSSVMVYGPSFAGALDVVGHEMTHGVITHEADLIYADEPGAVNEALSDIFGTLIEYSANNGNGNWVIGENLPGFSATKPLRSLANPHMQDADGNSMFNKDKGYAAENRGQPDHYAEYVRREHALCETTNDYFSGCVHFNSGILNKQGLNEFRILNPRNFH